MLCVRNPRARRIKLSVDERGVRLTLPPCASLDAGTRFLLEQRAWIEIQMARYASGTAAIPLRRGETTTLPLRDQQLPCIGTRAATHGWNWMHMAYSFI